MAATRDSDISLWLHNKLGTSADTWSEGSICSQLNVEVLRSIKECFVELQTQVKLKLLLAFFHIPKRNVEEWRVELEEILEVAVVDSEPWVAMLAEVMKTFPASGNLNTDIREPQENQRITQDLTTELRKQVKKHSELGLLPMECNYLNRNAFLAAAGQQAPLTKHFALKRKPKAAALRAELLNRSAEAQANVKKNVIPTVPVRSRGMPRKMTDTTPLKGIPSRLPGSGLRGSGMGSTPASRTTIARSSGPRKDGGIKLLDITESPIVVQQAKKRRKMQDTADAKAAEAEAKARDIAAAAESKAALAANLAATAAAQQPPATPDYAAGLTPSDPPTPGPATPSQLLTTTVTGTLHTANTVTVNTISARSGIPQSPVAVGRVLTASAAPGTPAGSGTPQRIIVTPSQNVSGTPTVVYRTITPSSLAELQAATTVTVATQNAAGETVMPAGQPQYATLQPVQPDLVYSTSNSGVAALSAVVTQPGQQTQQTQVITVPAPQTPHVTLTRQTPPAARIQQQVQQPQPPTTVTQTVVSPQAQQQEVQQQQQQTQQQQQQQNQKRSLSLTREQMLEAQEMFRTSNKVTRPEKALILGFMAGSRENPCPHLGNIVTIKLSEGEETVSQADGAFVNMLAETHFQMNYNTGEWKRIKKYRPLPVE
ncbi:unnamed protein product [Meganyctiphanes norvegica]|uniref:HDAg domain-containing protein n=1 Tax=Meganyctiphanes norvegica TaxID=48144 RepID=A0AAV2QXJ1_MEGNR